MKIAIGNDHRGYKLKKKVIEKLTAGHPEANGRGISFVDVGSDSEEKSDYPDYAIKVAQAILEKKCDRGILICGSGAGVAIVANKFPGIRAVVANDTESAKMTRLHNDSNVLCLGSDNGMTQQQAFNIIKAWLTTEFEGGRHIGRLKKIEELEKKLFK